MCHKHFRGYAEAAIITHDAKPATTLYYRVVALIVFFAVEMVHLEHYLSQWTF